MIEKPPGRVLQQQIESWMLLVLYRMLTLRLGSDNTKQLRVQGTSHIDFDHGFLQLFVLRAKLKGMDSKLLLMYAPSSLPWIRNERFPKDAYIKPERREVFDAHLEASAREIEGEGELNYCIYKLATLPISRIGESHDKLSMCSSAMEHAKLEWYRKELSLMRTKRSKRMGIFEASKECPIG
jgi:hypothetical protein